MRHGKGESLNTAPLGGFFLGDSMVNKEQIEMAWAAKVDQITTLGPRTELTKEGRDRARNRAKERMKNAEENARNQGKSVACPQCRGVAARPCEDGYYWDGQPIVCGCSGYVSFDSETPPHVVLL